VAKKRRKKKKFRGFFVICLLIIASIIITFTTPAFNISTVNVLGNEKLDPEQVKLASGIISGVNTFKISTKKAEKSISTIPYIDSVEVKRVLPGKINIKISECKIEAYIPFIASLVGIDKNGKVVEAVSSDTEVDRYKINVPIKEFNLGEKIAIDDTKITDIIIMYMDCFSRYEISDKIANVDITSLEDTSFTTKFGLVVKLGGSEDIDYKLKYYKRLLQEIGEEATGLLDLTNTADKVPYRKNI